MNGVPGDVRAGAATPVAAALNYLAPGSRRNRLYVAPGAHMTTTQYAPQTVWIEDGRPLRDDFGLDRSGFTLLDHRSRAVMTSMWRAFSPPPQDWPLAILDDRSVDDAEGEPNLLLFVDSIPEPDEVPDVIEDADAQPAGSIFAHHPAHRWWYFPGMRADEVLLFKLHDSDHSVAWRAPHTAFHDTGARDAHPRESIEIRTVAFFY